MAIMPTTSIQLPKTREIVRSGASTIDKEMVGTPVGADIVQ